MRNDERPTDNETDREPDQEPVDEEVPFIETLDAETRAQIDKLFERSTMLARDVIAAVYKR
jgi:hypothetical protein